jgi:hypothetical protein
MPEELKRVQFGGLLAQAQKKKHRLPYSRGSERATGLRADVGVGLLFYGEFSSSEKANV